MKVKVETKGAANAAQQHNTRSKSNNNANVISSEDDEKPKPPTEPPLPVGNDLLAVAGNPEDLIEEVSEDAEEENGHEDSSQDSAIAFYNSLAPASTAAATTNTLNNLLVSLDGMQSGVPTLTTPTLTPTTLRNIEETFIQLTSDNIPYQAGFMPPVAYPTTSAAGGTNSGGGGGGSIYNGGNLTDYGNDTATDEDSQNSSWNEANHLNEDNSLATTDNSTSATDSLSFHNGLAGSNSSTSGNNFTAAIAAANASAHKIRNNNNDNTSPSAPSLSTTTRRNQGGRRPAKSVNMSPEEEEKRRIRRERNKLAAARCRKRRVDQTNQLLEEVEGLEKKRAGLQKEIENLNSEKQELEFMLEAHRPTCEKIREDLLTVTTYNGLIAPATVACNSNDSTHNSKIIGLDSTLASTGRSASPLDLKPVIPHLQIKKEPFNLDTYATSDDDRSLSPPRPLFTPNNPMIAPPLPAVSTLSPSLASLNTPIVTSAPVSFDNFQMSKPQRPNTLPMGRRNFALNVDGKAPTDINGVAIQTPSAGVFNFDSLMDGGTGLTPVSGPLVPNCSTQNSHPLQLATPTTEPSKLVSL